MKPWVALLLLLSLASPAFAFDDAEFCKMLSSLAVKLNADKGGMIDGLTRNDGMVVSCDKKAVDFKKSVALVSAELNEKWRALKQQDWRDLYCRNGAWAPVIANGWSVSTTVTTLDGKSFTMFAECK